MDVRRNDTSRFKHELEAFETEVGAPIVPGEVQNWCLSLKGRLARLSDAWEALGRRDGRELEEILATDLELAHRVESLRQSRKELTAALEQYDARVRALLEAQADDPEGSWEPAAAVKDLRERFLTWIVRCRVHDREIETWLLEAIHRDRGDVD